MEIGASFGSTPGRVSASAPCDLDEGTWSVSRAQARRDSAPCSGSALPPASRGHAPCSGETTRTQRELGAFARYCILRLERELGERDAWMVERSSP
jgi:hypothetical protein